MQVRLQTVPALLRTRLPKVRVRLRGDRSVLVFEPKKPTQASSTPRRSLPKPLVFAIRSLLLLCAFGAFTVLAILFVPDVYYRVFSADTQPVTEYQRYDAAQEPSVIPSPSPVALPPQDMSLPEGEWLVIPRIGVRSQLRPTADPEDALAKGLWLVPDYGQPGDTDIPMIVAGHRYGWQWWWKTDYWKYNSFYQLPELEVGDRVEVIADHRKWVYEIYSAEEGEDITDYEADLILYTCKFLNSPVRYFRYAKLVSD